MIEKNRRLIGARFLVVWLCLQAFCSVLTLMDAAEQWRAWKAASAWTAEERDAGGARDAASLSALAGACNGASIAIACLSFLGLLSLGASAAGTRPGAGASRAAYRFSEGSVLCSAALGIAFAGLTLAYRVSVGTRTALKGPVRDFSLALEPTIAIGAIGLALVGIWAIAAFLAAVRARPAR
jgi:hypothetical protein